MPYPVEWEGCGVVRVNRVANKAPGGMGVKTYHEEERKMMSVPESLKTLLANLLMSGGIHEHHDEEHEMTSNSSCLSIVNLQCELLSDL